VNPSPWNRLVVQSIDGFRQAVQGAGLDAVQLSRGPMEGRLAFGACGGVAYSSGLVAGQMTLRGPLSETMVTLGVGVNIGPGSRHWLNEVETGGIGVFLPGDEHDALYTSGSIYACATLSFDEIEDIAAGLGLVLDARLLGGTGISSRPLSKRPLASLRNAFRQLHAGERRGSESSSAIGRYMLESIISALAREPRPMAGRANVHSHGRIVARAQDYIAQNLEHPLSIGAISRAAFASPSTLYRAFHEVLAETPQSFVRKLRLNRIRHDLATETEALCTVTLIANRWGIGELGRLAGWYRELFDELPSQTRRRRLQALRPTPAEMTISA
jgi:AraC-like DNA-binding protein